MQWTEIGTVYKRTFFKEINGEESFYVTKVSMIFYIDSCPRNLFFTG